jgi:hypothetical protein
MLAHVPNIGVLVVAGLLPLMWPRQRSATPPVPNLVQSRILFVHEATTQFDPTAIAVPDEELQFTDDPEDGVIALGHRLSRQLQPNPTFQQMTPPVRARTLTAKPTLATRAWNDLSRFTPPSTEPKVFPSLAPSPEPILYSFQGNFDPEGFTPPEWPNDLIAELPTPWSITAELSIDSNGRVEHVFLDEATESGSLNAKLTALLHRARFAPGAGGMRTALSISFQRTPADTP